MRKTVCKDFALIVAGGLLYSVIELIWRQRTHWTMALTGGTCFLLIYKLYRRFPFMSLPLKCILGSMIITTLEFIVGCVVNVLLGWSVWDYSRMPFNLMGQICLLYSVLWGVICIPISRICRFIDSFEIRRKRNLSD